MWRRLSAALLTLALSREAAAQRPDPDPQPPDPQPPSAGTRALAFGASVLPGALVHGSGHWVLGRHSAAAKLLAAQGIGLGLALMSGIPLVASGASRYVSGPTIATGVAGVGLFGLSWLADIAGVLVPMNARGAPQRTEAMVGSTIGYRYVADPAFAYHHFAFQRFDLRLGPVRLSPELWTALDEANARLRIEGAYRLLGPRPDRAAASGTHLDLRVAGGRHRFASDRFSAYGAEAAAAMRLDLVDLDRWLRGAFFELDLGVGWQRLAYDRAAADDEPVLLARFGYGLYLGDPARGAPFGEIAHHYDHRHDDFAAGLNGRALGLPGHMSLGLRLWLHEQVGVEAMGEVGAAWIGGLSLLVRSPLGEDR